MSDTPKDPRDTTGQPAQAIQPVMQGPPIALSLETVQGFEALQRAARLFASSDLVPKDYKGNIPNCTIALTVALRMKADPLMVFQNLNIIHGKPGWSSAFLIASVNTGGRFSPLRFEFVGTQGKDDWGCRAYATDLRSKERLDGTTVTIDMAKKEGWYGRQGSKWLTMPEQMLRYRAASWWIRAYAPEMSMGFLTREEIVDAGLDGPAYETDVTPSPGQKVVEALKEAVKADEKPTRTEAPQAKPESPPPAAPAEPAAKAPHRRSKQPAPVSEVVKERLIKAGLIPADPPTKVVQATPEQQRDLELEDEPEPGTDG